MLSAAKLLRWYHQYGRHHLPWQKNPTPYRVWVSEIMLQQTQVNAAIPYYQRFMRSFPSLKKLASADINSVLAHWSGLGYYARARNLHKAAQCIVEKYHGRFPKTVDALSNLPGIGRSTAGAILSFAMKIPATILDGNVKRVLTRFYAIEGWPGNTEVNKKLWEIAEKTTPKKDPHYYNQAIMDLGATLCTRTKPKCDLCPFTKDCKAHNQHRETEFPTRKKAKAKPIKEIYVLLLRREDGRLLLEKRPPVGIWGGLWSFPECTLDEDIAAYCRKRFHSHRINEQSWELISHQFSHFSLNMNPLLINIDLSSRFIMDSNSLFWYKVGNSLPGGIAAPIKQLLKKYEEAHEPYDFL